jgi:hypothetical protein
VILLRVGPLPIHDERRKARESRRLSVMRVIDDLIAEVQQAGDLSLANTREANDAGQIHSGEAAERTKPRVV